jgi:hypothetical protein
MTKMRRSLSVEELDLVEFLVVEVASLSSSLVVEVEVVGKPVIIDSSDLPPMAGDAVSLQPFPIVSPVPPSYGHWVGDALCDGLRASCRWHRGVLHGEAT